MNDVNIQSLISAIQSDNTEAADTAFRNSIMTRVNTALDVKKVELASNVYNQSSED